MPACFLRRSAVILALLLSAPAATRAEVVFGNLGPLGTGGIGDTNTDFGSGDAMELRLAQGFTTGTATAEIQSVTIGLWVSSSGTSFPRTVSLFGTANGKPDVPLYTSLPVAVGDTSKYTFPFSNALLAAQTTYWIVPNGSGSWYLDAADSAPTGFNGSGFSYVDTLRDQPGVGWTTPNPDLHSYSVSVVAVPEPPAIALAGVGVAAALFALRRRHG